MKDYINELKKDDAYINMDPRKQKMVELLVNSIKDQKLTQSLPALMTWNQKMKQENIVFSREENEMLTRILTAQMTPAQKKQYAYLMPFIAANSRK